MKKLLATLFLSFALLSGYNAAAQYEQGDKLVNVGINLGNGYGGGGLGFGGAFEYGFTDFISGGVQVDFSSWGDNWGTGKVRYTSLPIAARGSYHFGKHFIENEQFDFYGGAALGYYINNFKFDDNIGGVIGFDNGYGNKVLFGIFAGGRYYFKPNIAALAELGFNAAILKVGLTFKF